MALLGFLHLRLGEDDLREIDRLKAWTGAGNRCEVARTLIREGLRAQRVRSADARHQQGQPQ